jgi:CRISPR-associated protein Cas2
VRYVVAYDMADDRRRDDVATLLSGYGPRVQLSVFECEFRTRREAAAVQAKLRQLIDPIEDQVRLYPLAVRATRQVSVIGAPVIEERQDFWIIT